MVKAGTYKATIQKHAITETKAGDPQAMITFSFQADGQEQTLSWYGSFKEKAQKHTFKALIVCGLKGNNPAGPLEIGKEVQIVVEHETGEDNKTRAKIKWVNAIGGTVKAMDQKLATTKLAALEGAMMAARADLNTPDDSDDIPF